MKGFIAGILLAALVGIVAFAFLSGTVTITRVSSDGQPLNNMAIPPTPAPVQAAPQQIIVTATPPPVVQNLVTPLPGPTIDFQATTDAFYTNDPLPTAPPSLSSLPLTSPYSLEEIAICRAIWDQGLQNPMIQPQYGNCEHWLTITGK